MTAVHEISIGVRDRSLYQALGVVEFDTVRLAKHISPELLDLLARGRRSLGVGMSFDPGSGYDYYFADAGEAARLQKAVKHTSPAADQWIYGSCLMNSFDHLSLLVLPGVPALDEGILVDQLTTVVSGISPLARSERVGVVVDNHLTWVCHTTSLTTIEVGRFR